MTRDGKSNPSPPPARVSRSAAFARVYDEAHWGTNDDGQGHSGPGSTLHSTTVYRAFLQQFLRDRKIRSVVDAGCGDWQFSRAIDWTGVDYTGFDAVGRVVQTNNEHYRNEHIRFVRADIVDDTLPPADLLIVKHVLQHLPSRDVTEFLRKLPNYEHALITNGVDPISLSAKNRDTKPGAYRHLDLRAAPFGLPGQVALVYRDPLNTHQVLHLQRNGR